MNGLESLVFSDLAKAAQRSQPLLNEHPRIRTTNGLKLHPLGALGDNEEQPLCIQRGKELPMLINRADPIKQAKGGVIEILLSGHRGFH